MLCGLQQYLALRGEHRSRLFSFLGKFYLPMLVPDLYPWNHKSNGMVILAKKLKISHSFFITPIHTASYLEITSMYDMLTHQLKYACDKGNNSYYHIFVRGGSRILGKRGPISQLISKMFCK
jgi:hypothetical protein